MSMMRRAAALLVLATIALAGCDMVDALDGFGNAAPTAVIIASATEGAGPLEVTFDASGSWDDELILVYQWDFGDRYDAAMPQGLIVTHTYTRPGTYIAKLAVTDAHGKSGVRHLPITVTTPPPRAEFTVDNRFPAAGVSVQFAAGASSTPDGGPLSYEWAFGDGGTAIGVEVSHAFAEVEEYTVTLTITDEDGTSATKAMQIFVQDGSGGADTCLPGGATSCSSSGKKPSISLTGLGSVCQEPIGANEPLRLDASRSCAAFPKVIVDYQWDFGDGTTATGPVVEHTYAEPGVKYLVITVTDSGGIQTSQTYTVDVGACR
jgi:PKD repeat protein